jgi:hypothetical protein
MMKGNGPEKKVINEVAVEIQKHPMFATAIMASEKDGAKMSELKEMLILAAENATTKLYQRLKEALDLAFDTK